VSGGKLFISDAYSTVSECTTSGAIVNSALISGLDTR